MNILDGAIRASLLKARRELMVRLNIPREAMAVPDPDLSRLARDVEQDLDAYFVKSYQWVQVSLSEGRLAITGGTMATMGLARHAVVLPGAR